MTSEPFKFCCTCDNVYNKLFNSTETVIKICHIITWLKKSLD